MSVVLLKLLTSLTVSEICISTDQSFEISCLNSSLYVSELLYGINLLTFYCAITQGVQIQLLISFNSNIVLLKILLFVRVCGRRENL